MQLEGAGGVLKGFILSDFTAEEMSGELLTLCVGSDDHACHYRQHLP